MFKKLDQVEMQTTNGGAIITVGAIAAATKIVGGIAAKTALKAGMTKAATAAYVTQTTTMAIKAAGAAGLATDAAIVGYLFTRE